MTPAAAAKAIRNSSGQNWCAFTKLDGTRRDMRFRFRVVGELKGSGRRTNDDAIIVWDDDRNGYRQITPSRLIWVVIDGKCEEVRP